MSPYPERYHDGERFVLGPSDLATVCGWNRWETAKVLADRMLGLAPPKEETWAMFKGKEIEAALADWFERQHAHDQEIGPLTLLRVEREARHPEIPWLRCSLDRIVIVDGDPTKVVGPWEGKSTQSRAGWGRPGSDEVPQAHIIQTHGYMSHTRAARCWISADIRGQYAEYLVRYDAALWEWIKQTGEKFIEDVTAIAKERDAMMAGPLPW